MAAVVYVALLRGINVGGNNKIDMKQLKAAFEQAGMHNVVTYINTGNIIFTSDTGNKEELTELLEKTILELFGLAIKVLLRSLEEYSAMMQLLPETWTNGDTMKSDVLFLWEDVDDASVLDKLFIHPEYDRAIYAPGAILFSVDREHVNKSGMHKIIGTKLYQQVTVRNVNTTRKIYELMQQAPVKSI